MPVPKKPSETAEIYGLLDPRDGKLRYIGKAVCATKRLKSHLRDARRRHTPLYSWMRKLTAEGICPSVKVLETCSTADWPRREIIWIGFAREIGLSLLNLADGGNEPQCSYEVRAANARKASATRAFYTPLEAEIFLLKKAIGKHLVAGRMNDADKERLRYCAREAPHLFGAWASL